MMSKGDWAAITIVAGFIILWLLFDRQKLKVRLVELQDEIDKNNDLHTEIKKRLKDLVVSNSDVDPEVSNELSQIAALIEIKQDTKAILSMVKIVENLLVKIYNHDQRLNETAARNGRKRPAFMDHLDLALADKIISKEDYHLVSVAKIIRDDEAHELNVEKEKSRVLSSFISCIGLILALCKIAKKKLKHSESQEIDVTMSQAQ